MSENERKEVATLAALPELETAFHQLFVMAEKATCIEQSSLLEALSGDVPEFPDSQVLPTIVRAAWPLLPPVARLVAYLCALDLAGVDANRWDRYDRE
jgi:hypothetical protein